MKRVIPLIAVFALAAAGVTGCNKHTGTGSAYNNSGTNAAPGSASTTTASNTTSQSSDSSSPNSANTTAPTSSSDTSTSASGANMVADTATTGKVKLAIANEPNLKDADINVKTDGGVVTLSGTAKSQDQVTAAQNVAQKQEGVSRVDVQIAVR